MRCKCDTLLTRQNEHAEATRFWSFEPDRRVAATFSEKITVPARRFLIPRFVLRKFSPCAPELRTSQKQTSLVHLESDSDFHRRLRSKPAAKCTCALVQIWVDNYKEGINCAGSFRVMALLNALKVKVKKVVTSRSANLLIYWNQ